MSDTDRVTAAQIFEAYKAKLFTGLLTGAAGATLSLAFRPIARAIDERMAIKPSQALVSYAQMRYPELQKIEPAILYGYAKLLMTSYKTGRENMPFMAVQLRDAVNKGGSAPGSWQSPGSSQELIKWAKEKTMTQKEQTKTAADDSGIVDKVLVGAGLAAGAWGINKALNTGSGIMNAHHHRKAFERSLAHVVETNPVIHNAYKSNPKKVQSFAESIHNFAPRVSGDPNILSSLLSNAVHGESLDPMTVRSLLEMEGAQKRNREEPFNPAGPVKVG